MLRLVDLTYEVGTPGVIITCDVIVKAPGRSPGQPKPIAF
jgi:hypothetical protein